MLKRGALAALVLSTMAIGAAYASAFANGGAPTWASWAMALGTTTCMVAITVLAVASGVSARTRRAPLALVLGALAGVWALISACFALALLLPPETGGGAESLWLGLPRRAAIVLFGVGIVPLFVLPFVYAATFDALTLPEEELARIRAAAKRTPKVDPREAAA